jgi:nicotinamidase-related amidase
MHSVLYQTPFELLLRQPGASSLFLGGLATNSCSLCTAHDANMRDLKVTVVEDCCAATLKASKNYTKTRKRHSGLWARRLSAKANTEPSPIRKASSSVATSSTSRSRFAEH